MKNMIKESVNGITLETRSTSLSELIKFSGLEPELYFYDADEYSEKKFDLESFKKVFIKLSNEYLSKVYSEIKDEFDGLKKIKAVGIYSPKEYNNETDAIDIDLLVSDKFVKTLLHYYEKTKKIESKKLNSFLKKNYGSYDGFISFAAYSIEKIDEVLEEYKIGDKKYDHVLLSLFNYKLSVSGVLKGFESFEDYCRGYFGNYSYGNYIIESKQSFRNMKMNENQLLNLKHIKNINDFDKIDEKSKNKCEDDEKIKIMTKAMKEVEEAVGEKFFDFKSVKCEDNAVVATVRIVNKYYKIECENINDKNPEFEIELKDEDVFEGDLKALITFVKKKAKVNENGKWKNDDERQNSILYMTAFLNDIKKTIGEKYFKLQDIKTYDIYHGALAKVKIFNETYIMWIINTETNEFFIQDFYIENTYDDSSDSKGFKGKIEDIISMLKSEIKKGDVKMNEAWYNTKEEKADITEIDNIIGRIQKELDVTLEESEIKMLKNMFKDLEKINTNKISLNNFLNDKTKNVDEKINQLEKAFNNAKEDKYYGYVLYVDGVLKYVSYKNLKYKTNIPGANL